MNTNSAFALICALFIFVSCKKEEEPENHDLTAAKDMSLIYGAYADAFSQVDKVGKSESDLRDNNYGLPECVTVILQDTVQFPYSLTIDFGESNCYDDYGIGRRGKIHVTITGLYQSAGTQIITELEDYHVIDHHLQGTRTVTNLGADPVTGNLKYSVVEENVTLTAPDGSWTSFWESSRTREWTEGQGTWWWWLDDVYEITGDAEGITRTGIPYTINISDPLVVKVGCPWVVQGTLDLYPDGYPTFTLDYGNGNCDDNATVTVEGQVYNINL